MGHVFRRMNRDGMYTYLLGNERVSVLGFEVRLIRHVWCVCMYGFRVFSKIRRLTREGVLLNYDGRQMIGIGNQFPGRRNLFKREVYRKEDVISCLSGVVLCDHDPGVVLNLTQGTSRYSESSREKAPCN